MRLVGIVNLVVCLALASGCHHCCWGKRASEKRCPTDVRKSHFWCFGEDAIFHTPCGPRAETYGYQPTCWREWPMSGTVWRDLYCGPTVQVVVPEPAELPPPAGTAPNVSNGIQQINPFRGGEPMSLPPEQPEQIESLPPETTVPDGPSGLNRPNQFRGDAPTSIKKQEPVFLPLLGSSRAPPLSIESYNLPPTKDDAGSLPPSASFATRPAVYVEQLQKPRSDQQPVPIFRRLPPTNG